METESGNFNSNPNDHPHQEMNTTQPGDEKYDENRILCSQHENTIC